MLECVSNIFIVNFGLLYFVGLLVWKSRYRGLLYFRGYQFSWIELKWRIHGIQFRSHNSYRKLLFRCYWNSWMGPSMKTTKICTPQKFSHSQHFCKTFIKIVRQVECISTALKACCKWSELELSIIRGHRRLIDLCVNTFDFLTEGTSLWST